MTVPAKHEEIITDDEAGVAVASYRASSPHPLGTLEGVLGLVIIVVWGDP